MATATETRPPTKSRSPGGLLPTAKRVMAGMKEHNTPVAAAGVAFFGLLAVVPTLVALISIYGLVFEADDITDQINDLAENLPAETADFVAKQMTEVATSTGSSLGIGLVIGVGGALWAASGAVNNLIKAVNHIYGYADERGFVKTRALALGLLVATLLFIVLASAVMGFIPALLRRTALGGVGGTLVSLVFWPVLFVVMVGGLSALYRLAPARRPMMRGWWTWGGVVGATIFFVGSIGFVIYANVMGSQTAAYGVFSAVLLLMLWLLIAANAVLIGAEVNAELEKQGRW